MRRSVRSKMPQSHAVRGPRAGSPSSSEITEIVATPNVSPTPEGPTRQYGTPGCREDGTPKRPMNAFILFSNEKRSELADMNPHLCALLSIPPIAELTLCPRGLARATWAARDAARTSAMSLTTPPPPASQPAPVATRPPACSPSRVPQVQCSCLRPFGAALA